MITTGYDEGAAKKHGLIRWGNQAVSEITEVILQGPHFASAIPFSKEPKIPCRSNRDWSLISQTELPESYVPVTNYVRAADEATYMGAQSQWLGEPFTAFFRLAWRAMIPFDSSRCLHAALVPPGPAHVHTVQSMAFEDSRLTALNAGFWAALLWTTCCASRAVPTSRPAKLARCPPPTPSTPSPPPSSSAPCA